MLQQRAQCRYKKIKCQEHVDKIQISKGRQQNVYSKCKKQLIITVVHTAKCKYFTAEICMLTVTNLFVRDGDVEK